MNHQPDFDSNSSSEAEVAEEFALHQALKRTRLEEAAASPVVFSKFNWLFLVVGVLAAIMFEDYLAAHPSVFIIYFGVAIHSGIASVHARIDALVQLEALSKTTHASKIIQDSEQAAP